MQSGAVAFIEDDCISCLRNYKSEIIDFRAIIFDFGMEGRQRGLVTISRCVARVGVSSHFVALVSLWCMTRCCASNPVSCDHKWGWSITRNFRPLRTTCRLSAIASIP
jgi:hypothetical protein